MAIIKVKTGGITADAVTDALIADDVVGTEHLTANEVDTTALGADAVTGAQLADNAVNSEHYTDGSVDTAHIADAQITTAKLSTAVLTGATDIGADIADADLFLVDDGAGGTLRKTAASRLKTYVGSNTPAFQVLLSSSQSIPNTTNTKVTVSHELFDTDNAFASNRFTVPSGKGGSYLFNFGVQPDAWSFGRFIIYMYKNNSAYAYVEMADDDNSPTNNRSLNSSTYMQLSAGDYIEMYVYQNNGSAQTIRGDTNEILTYFGGHRLIT